MSSIKIYLQEGDIRKKDLIIEVIDGDIQRGKIGLAMNNLNGVWFSAMTMAPGVKSYMKQVRSYDKCVSNASQSHINKYCNSR